MRIQKTPFGQIDGREATLYTLTNAAGAQLKLCDFGAHIVSILVPDARGALADVCLGFDSVSGYAQRGDSYIGGTIGRVGNRIAGSSIPLNGKAYQLFANEGKNTLHGGERGFDRRWWQATCEEGKEADIVVMTYDSPDGEEGYPGALHVAVHFAWTAQNELVLCYQATAEADTVCNLTNHAYFNLAGKGDILDHQIQINAPLATETDDALIPTGREVDVTGLPIDLRRLTVMRDGLARAGEYPIMQTVKGYDLNYFIPGEGLRDIAALRDPASGRVMRVLSTEPCVQFYSGQGLNATGHGGAHYGAYAGLALETQHHPDAVHHNNFPAILLRGGETYESRTVYSFFTEQ